MLHWIVLYSDTSSCGAIQSTFIFISQGVQTLTQEDRDINGWLHFLRIVYFPPSRGQKRTIMKQISQEEVLSCLKKFEGYSEFKKYGRMQGLYMYASIVFFVNTAEDVEAYFTMPYIEGIDYESVLEFMRLARLELKKQLN